ncbi:uncharacterized protein LOC142354359 isoform X2 [Convolutriloba macropyga]|uniref:uncharacterized protein LOC142354359 isoform X2 n=1 Tax=Convolutriloba macropyga TaxID=536237 RepID=UPI003F527285
MDKKTWNLTGKQKKNYNSQISLFETKTAAPPFEELEETAKLWISEPDFISDGYFKPRWGFRVKWNGTQNAFTIAVLQDRKFKTLSGLVQKTIIVYEYERLDATFDAVSGEHMQSGINSPNKTIKWQPVGSGSRKLGNYLVNMGRYQDGMGGMYLYEMNPNMTGQVLQEYLKSDCNNRNCTLPTKQQRWENAVKFSEIRKPIVDRYNDERKNELDRANVTAILKEEEHVIRLHQMQCCDNPHPKLDE